MTFSIVDSDWSTDAITVIRDAYETYKPIRSEFVPERPDHHGPDEETHN